MTYPPAADAVSSPRAAGGSGGLEGDGLLDAWVERARLGDMAAFAEVVAALEKRTYHFVLRILSQPHDAEDVTQETFVKAWRALPRYRARQQFLPWLFTIARRSALNHLRARRPTEELRDHDLPVEEDPAEAAAAAGDAASLWETARRLKPDQYEALWLCYGEGFAVAEAARIMNTNAIRVRVLLHRGRKRMAEWLSPPPPASQPSAKSRRS